ncbi:hypothetical protein K2X85_13785 [bacterium]|nr:hypothetical protein [bacterium]
MEKAWFITTHMFNFRGVSLGQLYNLGLPRSEMTHAFLWIVFLMIVDHCLSNRPMWARNPWEYRLFRHLSYLVPVYAIAFFSVFTKVEFIYFEF